MVASERGMTQALSQYIQMQYPGVLYRFDLAADQRLTIGQAKKNKTLNPHRGFPDLFVCVPKSGYAGLFIELKKDGTKLYKKDGSIIKNTHINEQKEVLDRLNNSGYYATFAVGFEHAKRIIDSYMKKGSVFL